MHIEPGLVDGAKLALSVATAAACGGYTLKLSADTIRKDGAVALLLRALLATALRKAMPSTLMQSIIVETQQIQG